MTVLLLTDTETSGLDPAADRLLEVGAAAYDLDLGAVIRCASWLVHGTENAAAVTNRIAPELVARNGWPLEAVHAAWVEMAREDNASYVVAHNAAFDRQWLPELGIPWIDSCSDVWPRVDRDQASLTTIALAYDVGVVRAHRAIEDCLTLAAVLTRVHETEGGLDAWLARMLEPRIEVRALVSYDDRDKAKQAGFHWDAGRRLWVRSVRESQLGTLTASLAFETRRVA